MPIGVVIGVIIIAIGLVIWAWCVLWFFKAKGTPVPFNPPRELVTTGPYAWSRNPMLTGVFAFLIGFGFLLRSVSLVFICTPIFVVLNVLELKFVEEPELELRFGEKYKVYQEQVGMFFPRGLWHQEEESK
jgi:protein-S-isoprenylcysteine O-methyltransferase Ste14